MVANNDLPRLDRRYYNLKSEVDSLEAKKQNLVRIIQDYGGQAAALEKYRSLIGYDSSTDYTIPDFNPFYYMCGQQLQPQQPIQSKVYFIEDYVAMLSDYKNGPYFYPFLAQTIDNAHVMCYDFHFLGGDHLGPVAPKAWVKDVIQLRIICFMIVPKTPIMFRAHLTKFLIRIIQDIICGMMQVSNLTVMESLLPVLHS